MRIPYHATCLLGFELSMPSIARAGDRVLLIDRRHKRHIVTLRSGETFHSDRGMLHHDQLIGAPLGRRVFTHLDEPFIALRPNLSDLTKTIRRSTQIVYPKDSGYTVMKMGIGAGSEIIEAGTGSGGLTLVLAHTVMPTGHVYSYEKRDDMCRIAAVNLQQVGLDDYVTFHHRDIAAGFEQQDVDAVFLDVREPWAYLDQVEASLGSGGFFGALLPTTNQVSELIDAMQGGPWFDREVAETFVRNYKINAQRLRPTDRMVAHTAYLIFARYVPKLQEEKD